MRQDLGETEDGFEACDDGNSAADDACTDTCAQAVCGDGIRRVDLAEGEPQAEACDDGNDSQADACLGDCRIAICGDGIVHAGVETCDDGNRDDSDACTNACRSASCGDGIVGNGEACDDGNQNQNDACLNTCAEARCGDGHIRANVETCDDGNNNNGDGCSKICESEMPQGCIQVANGRARFTFACNLAYNFDQARGHCQDAGADLVTPLSRDDNRALNTAAEDTGWGGDFWLGFRDPAGRGNGRGAYVGVASDAMFWRNGEPNVRGESCARYRNGNEDRWYDDLCSRGHRFICEIQ